MSSTRAADEPTVSGARRSTEPVVLGFCSALSDRTGASAPVIRAAIITLSVAGGLGVVLYLFGAIWARVDRWTGAQAPAKPDPAADAGVLVSTFGLLWLAIRIWPGSSPFLIVPVALVSAGISLGWRSAADRPGVDHGPDTLDARRANGRGSELRRVLVRVTAGLFLCVAGMVVIFSQSTDAATVRNTLLALVVALTGVGLVVGPSVVAGIRSLTTERDGRMKAQARAEVAAHLHDSVLQTLTLIQKQAGNPTEVASLARQEERALRRWLYGTSIAYQASGSADAATSWRSEFESMVDEVERRYGVAIETVLVGPSDDPDPAALTALVAAAREALINAAKFSGVRSISLYVELNGGQMQAFVRDRGVGFAPDRVGADRRGIRDSIHGRIDSAGGTSTIRSAPGDGTEVAMSVPVDVTEGAR